MKGILVFSCRCRVKLREKSLFSCYYDFNQSGGPLFHTYVTLFCPYTQSYLHHLKGRTVTGTLFFNKISTFWKLPQNQVKKAWKLISMLRFLHYKINNTVPYLVMYYSNVLIAGVREGEKRGRGGGE